MFLETNGSKRMNSLIVFKLQYFEYVRNNEYELFSFLNGFD